MLARNLVQFLIFHNVALLLLRKQWPRSHIVQTSFNLWTWDELSFSNNDVGRESICPLSLQKNNSINMTIYCSVRTRVWPFFFFFFFVTKYSCGLCRFNSMRAKSAFYAQGSKMTALTRIGIFQWRSLQRHCQSSSSWEKHCNSRKNNSTVSRIKLA